MRSKLLVVLPLAAVLLACASDTSTVPSAGSKGGSAGNAGANAGGAAGKVGGAAGSTAAGAAGAGAKGGAAGNVAAGNAGTAGSTSAGSGGAAGSANAGAAGNAQAGASGQSGAGQAGQTAGGQSGVGGANTAGTGGNGAAGNGGAGGAFCDVAACQGACLATGCCQQTNVCGDICCDAGQACLFGACVSPGAACQSAGDCGEGKYCETALGNEATGGAGGGAGASGQGGAAGGPVCTQSLPRNGRCLPKAVVCTTPGVPAGCVEACEFKPTAGNLDAVKKWQWGPVATEYPQRTDVWSSPAVGRVVDANCDEKVDELDPPNVVFVSGRSFDEATKLGQCCHCNGTTPTACHTGALRVLDGRSGAELLSVFQAFPGSVGIAGVSVALGDIDGDKATDIVAVTGEGTVVVLDRRGKLIGQADKAFPDASNVIFGWGGGLALGDMDGDGHPEIALGSTLYSTKNMLQTGVITQLFTGALGSGANNALVAAATPLSYFADLDGNGTLELVAGNTAYRLDGSTLWTQPAITDGFTAVADFDRNGVPELAHVADGKLTILNGATGAVLGERFTLPGNGSGGPPTVADFTGDGRPDVGVAQQNRYSVIDIQLGQPIKTVWSVENHDLSSSVTGSSVFDFEGDGRAEVIYADECFLWVFDGQTGDVRFATPTTSFTGTESSIVADVDGDGHAELVWLANGADPSVNGWKCDIAPWNQPDPARNRPAWVPGPATGGGYRGLAVYGDKKNSWVGTRTLWNQHAYSVTNVCDQRDAACAPNASYGEIPMTQKENWKLPWLDNFRQNVQDKGLFDAPDAIVSVDATCVSPVVARISLRNAGLAALPAGVQVELLRQDGDFLLETFTTQAPLGAGQTVTFTKVVPTNEAGKNDGYYGRVPTGQAFRECRENNNASVPVKPACKD